MADFEAVLRKTLSGMTDPSADARAKVYDRARATIERQIAALPKRPSEEVIKRQYQKLEAAIAVVEEDYDEPDKPVLSDLRPAPAAEEDPLASFLAEQEAEGSPFSSRPRKPGASPKREREREPKPDSERRPPEMAAPKGGRGTMFWAAVAIAVLIIGGGIGYAAYAVLSPSEIVTRTEDGLPLREVPSTTVSVNDTDSSGQVDTADEVDADAPPKFTQRLTPDGREVDEGPAVSPGSNGEGTSVAGQSPGGGSDTQADAGDTASPAAGTRDDGQQTGLPVGQRAIFYQERTGTQAGTAEAGSTIWRVVQESPGGDLPPEPAIRAEAQVPELGMTLELTIRRNQDETFPASHVIELFFRLPDSFEGRGIADVQRITFKDTEQDPGNALIGVAAPLDTNIFLIALTDASTAIDTNLSLMRREQWIDIPMQYVSGRRALITLEKGIPGEQVFNEVLSAWEKKLSEG